MPMSNSNKSSNSGAGAGVRIFGFDGAAAELLMGVVFVDGRRVRGKSSVDMSFI